MRVAGLIVAAAILAPVTTWAQEGPIVSAFRELHAAMVSDPPRAAAAVQKMADAVAAWNRRETDRPPLPALLADERSEPPILPLAAYAEGFSYLQRGDYSRAIEALRRAAVSDVDERSQLVAAGVLAQQGRDLDAERLLRDVVAAFPESGVARWWLARIEDRLNNLVDARRDYERAAAIALTGRAPLYAAIARLARTAGDFDGAAAAEERRVMLTPVDPDAHKDLARIYIEQERTADALKALERTISLAPRDAEAHALIGRVRLDAGNPAEAAASLRLALDLMPTLFEARYTLALALRQIGRPEEAQRELALFERARSQSTEERRRTFAEEVQRQDHAQPTAR